MPSIFFSVASSPMRFSTASPLTWYGSSSTMIACLPPLLDLLDVRARADDHAAAAGAIALAHALQRRRRCRAWESPAPAGCSIRSSTDDSGLSISATQALIVSVRLCGGMLVAMPTAMPDEPLTSRFGNFGRQHRRLPLLAVVVRDEVDRFLVDVGGQLVGDALEPAFGVAHGRGVVAVDRAEVALAVDQRVAQRERLRHAHEGVVDREVAVRVVLAHHVADHPGALHVRPVPDGVGLVHRDTAPADAPV